jgi:hypothetical protein
MMRGIIVANNEPLINSRDWSEIIDSYDVVVRFGKCRGLGENAGRKTSYLFTLVDRGAIEEGAYPERLHILRHYRPTIILTNWNGNALEYSAWKNAHSILEVSPLITLASTYRQQAKIELAAHNSTLPHQPSIGVVAWQWLKHVNDVNFELFGFAHEGTEHHDWQAEKRYFDSLCASGRLRRYAVSG